MKLLIAGADSQLGMELSQLLQKQNVEHEALSAKELGLPKRKEALAAVKRIKPTQVINAATCANLEKAETDKEAAKLCDLINAKGVSALAEVCGQFDIPLLHHSSSHVFDGQKSKAYREEDKANPISRYGLSKWHGECAVQDLASKHIILRTDWLFSVHCNSFFRRRIDACKKNQGLIEVMDRRFCPTPASDAARVIYAIARQVDCDAQVWGIYHYNSRQPINQDQFVEELLKEASNYDADLQTALKSLKIKLKPVESPHIPNSVLRCDKIMATFGIMQRSRAQGIAEALEDLHK